MKVTSTIDHMRYQKVVSIAMPMDYDEDIIRQLISGVSPNDLKCNLGKHSIEFLLDHLIERTGEKK